MACKANEPSAQGNALGIYVPDKTRPERAKALDSNAFALSGRTHTLQCKPRAMPWADGFLPLWGVSKPPQAKTEYKERHIAAL